MTAPGSRTGDGAPVLVTGGAGFIGSALVRHLVGDLGYEVVNVDKLTYAGNLLSLAPLRGHPRHHFHRLDIRDREALASLLERYRPRAIVHLAAESHVDRSIDGPRAFLETNVLGTFELLEATRGWLERLPPGERDRFRFLHVSTDEVYGDLGPSGAFTESSPYRPSSPYAASKAASDHLARAWQRTWGIPVLVTHCSNNYGPCQFPEKLIPLATLNGLEGRPIPLYGTGENVRDWLYVEDHARALVAVLERGAPGETYDIGGGAERTNRAVLERICDELDRLRPAGAPHGRLIELVPDRPGHDRRYAIDATKIREALGWTPRESFESGLARTVRWYLDNEPWWRAVLDGSYRRERLGLGRGPAAEAAAP